MLSNRCSKILLELVNNHRPVTLQYLANVFNVSRRTVRYDLDEIDYFLKTAQLMPICRKTNTGVYFTGDEIAREAVLEAMSQVVANSVVYTTSERRLIIVINRCLYEEAYTIESMSGYLGVSMSTTLKDMDYLKNLFASFGVSFKFFALHGDEEAIRNAIGGVITTLLDKKTAYEIVRYVLGERDMILSPVYYQIFLKVGADILQQCIALVERHLQRTLSKETLLTYAIRLAVQAGRIHRGRHLPCDDKVYLFDDDISEIATEIYTLWDCDDKVLGSGEKRYLLQTVEKTKYSYIMLTDAINMADLQFMVLRIIHQVLVLLGRRVEYDPLLRDHLLQEIPNIISRAKTDVIQKQYYLRTFLEHYSQLFEAVRVATEPIGLLLGRRLQDDEVVLIALYFSDYLERVKLDNRRPQVALVSPEHGAVMELVRDRLQLLFAVDVVAQLAIYELTQLETLDVDYVISIHVLIERNIPSIQISPFLSEHDVRNLRTLLPIAPPAAPTADKLHRCGMAELLQAGLVHLDFAGHNLREVMQASFAILDANGCVESEFLQDLSATVNDIGLQSTQVCKVLFLYSRNFAYSRKLGLSVLRLQRQMELPHKQPGSDDIRFVFTLSTPNDTAHQRLLEELVETLGDAKRLALMEQAATAEEFVQIFTQK